jgi:hypothetical protein
MLSGFNTNVRHRSVLFHVQSEDSGRRHPHVITHLYHAGTILASEKISYAHRVHEPDLPGVVRELMDRQHKEVLRRLAAGDFDALIRERLGPSVFPDDGDTVSATRPALGSTGAEASDSEAATLREPEGAATFGDGIVSEKPLDEVILDYLVESARQRKRRAK